MCFLALVFDVHFLNLADESLHLDLSQRQLLINIGLLFLYCFLSIRTQLRHKFVACKHGIRSSRRPRVVVPLRFVRHARLANLVPLGCFASLQDFDVVRQLVDGIEKELLRGREAIRSGLALALLLVGFIC